MVAFGDIDAHFDHRRRNQDLRAPALERLHRRFFFAGPEPPVQQADRNIGEDLLRQVLVHLLRRLHRLGLGLFDDRVNHVSLAARIDLAADRAVGQFDLVRRVMLCQDSLAAGRHFVDHRDVEIAVQGHRQRAWNGRGGHDEHVRRHALLGQFEALHHAETMLLVDDDEAELRELDVFLDAAHACPRRPGSARSEAFL